MSDTPVPAVSPRAVALFCLAVVAAIALVLYGMVAIGPWVLGLTALAAVPVIFVALLLITVGK